MKKAMKVMLGLVAVLVALSMIGCGGEPDLNPTYLFQEKATINAADDTVTLDKEGVTWSIKGCENGDTDPENDLAKYDATGIIYLDGNVVKVVDGYHTNGENVDVRVFGTSTKDSYKYGWYDITLNIDATYGPWKIAVNNEVATTVVTSMKVNNVEQLTESKTVNDATMQAFWGSAAIIEAPEYFDIEILAENTPGTGNWNNFAICMSNNVAATAWENTAILRADYYSAGWNAWPTFPSWLSKSTTNADAHVDIEGFDAGIINWDTFLADCTGNVKIKMTRTEESSAYIHFQIFVDPEKDGEYKNLFNALWVLAGINVEGQPIPGVATEGGEGEEPEAGEALVLDVVYDFKENVPSTLPTTDTLISADWEVLPSTPAESDVVFEWIPTKDRKGKFNGGFKISKGSSAEDMIKISSSADILVTVTYKFNGEHDAAKVRAINVGDKTDTMTSETIKDNEYTLTASASKEVIIGANGMNILKIETKAAN